MKLSWISDYLRDIVEDAIKEALAPIAPWLRKLAGGMVLVLLSTFSFALVLLAVAGALFFAFAGMPLVAAALWTALIFFVLGLAFLGTGIGLIKRPRRY